MLTKPNLNPRHCDLFSFGHEQLFTELTSEEAAAIVGGSIIQFSHIYLDSQANNVCLYVNNQRLWSAPITETSPRTININEDVNFRSRAAVELYENCGESQPGNCDQHCHWTAIPCLPFDDATAHR